MPPPRAHTPCRLLVVTGPPNVGKTTCAVNVARDIIANAPHVQVLGFFTEEVRNDAGERVGMDVVTVDGEQRAVLARTEELSSAPAGSPTVGKYIVDVAAFESVALPVLEAAALGELPQLLLVDEMGKMEAFSDRFVDAIEKTLATSGSRGRVTLMVVAIKGTGIIAGCRGRPDSSTFTVSVATRETMGPTAVTEKLRTLFGIRPHTWELLPERKGDGVVRGPLDLSAGRGAGGGAGAAGPSKSAKKAAALAKKKAAAAAVAAVGGGLDVSVEVAPGPAPEPAAIDPAKEAKKIQKKIRQIEQLEEKQAGGATLEATQLEKLATKTGLVAQLAELTK